MSKKLGLLGLGLIMACALGVSAGSARAALPEFTVQGVAAGASEELASTVTVTPAGGDITITIPMVGQITCTELTLDQAKIKNQTDEDSVTSLTLFGCTVRGPNGEATTCKVKQVGGTNGQIHSGPMNTTLVTVSSSVYDIYAPSSSEELLFEMQITECGLESKQRVHGTIAFKILSPASGVLATTMEVETSQAIAMAAGTHLFAGLREIFIDAKLDFHLVSDRNWGIDW